MASPAYAAPRDTVEQVATLIEDNYFDAARAHEIADALRCADRAGEFDAIHEPRSLATALTLLLHPLDRHLRVTWSPTAAGSDTLDGLDRIPDVTPGQIALTSAYGFRRVEMLPGGIGYIELESFADLSLHHQDDPARNTANAALELTTNANALIIDLRDNVGGSLDMAGYLISAFTAKDADIYDVTRSRDGTQSDKPTIAYRTPRLDVPLYILISARTASAAEALAYTLQATKRALIVGDISAGAANSGGTFPLTDGFAVFVPVGTPINPMTHANWEGTGIMPDFPIKAQLALGYAQRLALASILAKNPNGSASRYVRLVLQALRAESAPPPGRPLTEYRGSYSGAIVAAENHELTLSQGDRTPLVLLRLQGDVFFDRAEPSRRVIFERNSSGGLEGLELIYSNGHIVWFPRKPLRIRPLELHSSHISMLKERLSIRRKLAVSANGVLLGESVLGLLPGADQVAERGSRERPAEVISLVLITA